MSDFFLGTGGFSLQIMLDYLASLEMWPTKQVAGQKGYKTGFERFQGFLHARAHRWFR